MTAKDLKNIAEAYELVTKTYETSWGEYSGKKVLTTYHRMERECNDRLCKVRDNLRELCRKYNIPEREIAEALVVD